MLQTILNLYKKKKIKEEKLTLEYYIILIKFDP